MMMQRTIIYFFLSIGGFHYVVLSAVEVFILACNVRELLNKIADSLQLFFPVSQNSVSLFCLFLLA